MAVAKAFIENQIGPAVDSLRRCTKAIDLGLPRMTEDFDTLIRLD